MAKCNQLAPLPMKGLKRLSNLIFVAL